MIYRQQLNGPPLSSFHKPSSAKIDMPVLTFLPCKMVWWYSESGSLTKITKPHPKLSTWTYPSCPECGAPSQVHELLPPALKCYLRKTYSSPVLAVLRLHNMYVFLAARLCMGRCSFPFRPWLSLFCLRTSVFSFFLFIFGVYGHLTIV